MTTQNDRLESVTLKATWDLEYTEKELREAAANLISDMQRMVAHLDENYHINGLGEVQGRGLNIDRLCAKREDLVSTIKALTYIKGDES